MFPECAKCGIIGTEKTLVRGKDDWYCNEWSACMEYRLKQMENRAPRYKVHGHFECQQPGCCNAVATPNLCPVHTDPSWGCTPTHEPGRLLPYCDSCKRIY